MSALVVSVPISSEEAQSIFPLTGLLEALELPWACPLPPAATPGDLESLGPVWHLLTFSRCLECPRTSQMALMFGQLHWGLTYVVNGVQKLILTTWQDVWGAGLLAELKVPLTVVDVQAPPFGYLNLKHNPTWRTSFTSSWKSQFGEYKWFIFKSFSVAKLVGLYSRLW